MEFELDDASEEVAEAGASPAAAAAVPQFFELLRPLLEVLADGRDWKVPDASEAVADRLGLDDEVRVLRVRSGRLLFENRIRWAFTNLSKAGLAELVGPSTIRSTNDGRSVLDTEEEIDRDLLLRTRPSYAAWHVDMGIEEPKPAEAEAGAGVWMVRAGRGGVYAPHFVTRSAAIVGWGETGDVSGLAREAIADRVDEAFPGDGARQRGQATNTLYHLVYSMRSGDLVVTPEPASRTLLLGRVSAPYRYLNDPIGSSSKSSYESSSRDTRANQPTSRACLYRATIALTLSRAPRDFHTAAPLTSDLIEEEKIDDHHVFPRAFLRDLGRGTETDSILNHVLIDRATNLRIGKNPPSKYLAEIRTVLGDGLDAVLASHALPAEADSPLGRDDFDAFLTWRLEHLAELLAEKTGQSDAPVPTMPPHLRTLDARMEEVELALRRLIDERLGGESERLPPHVTQKARERIDTASRKQPGLTQRQSKALSTQLQYFDLRELQETITAKPLWRLFADVFMTKEAVAMRFGQLAELRNGIRHSREVTAIMRNDGEAAIGWFRQALAAAQVSVTTDSTASPKP